MRSVRAVKVNQGGKQLYMASLPLTYLLDKSLFQIDYWDAAKKKDPSKQGYQRATSATHRSQIARYLSGLTKDKELSNIIPMSVYLNARKQFKVKELGNGQVEIDLEGSYPLYVVDGQHRLEGARYAIEQLGQTDVGVYEMPVIISQLDKLEEIWHFKNINTKGKRVPTDLGQRLMQDLSQIGARPLTGTRDAWLGKALTVADHLNEHEGVWHDRIQLPNVKSAPHFVVKQNSFVQSLKPLYKNTRLERALADEVIEVVENFWQAVAETWPTAFNEPSKNVIQKTTGLFSLHFLLTDILKEQPRADKRKFKELLADVKNNMPLDDDYWLSANKSYGAGQYGSMAGFAILNERMYNAINPGSWS